MSKIPSGEEGSPTPDELKSRIEGRNITEIAEMLAQKLTQDEMYELVLAIEDPDFHAAFIQKWQEMKHEKWKEGRKSETAQ